MSDEEEEVPTDEMIEMLKDAEGLKQQGWNITPKGYIALTLMTQLGMELHKAERLSQAIEDAIFLGGYNYVRANNVFEVPGDARDI